MELLLLIFSPILLAILCRLLVFIAIGSLFNNPQILGEPFNKLAISIIFGYFACIIAIMIYRASTIKRDGLDSYSHRSALDMGIEIPIPWKKKIRVTMVKSFQYVTFLFLSALIAASLIEDYKVIAVIILLPLFYLNLKWISHYTVSFHGKRFISVMLTMIGISLYIYIRRLVTGNASYDIGNKPIDFIVFFAILYLCYKLDVIKRFKK